MVRIQSGDTEFVLQLCKLDITLVYYIKKIEQVVHKNTNVCPKVKKRSLNIYYPWNLAIKNSQFFFNIYKS